jgi:hypothetical protein
MAFTHACQSLELTARQERDRVGGVVWQLLRRTRGVAASNIFVIG